MAELMFKRGTQSNLNTIIQNKTAVDGCFYLTTDTNRLYVGKGENNAPVLLNQTVQVVNSIGDLPSSPPAADNDFYYVKESNILAVYDSSSSTASKWVQINPNTNDTIRITGATFGDGIKDEEKNTVTYKLTVNQEKTSIDGIKTTLDAVEADLVLTSSLVSGIVPKAASVGLAAKTSGDNVAISTFGEGSNDTKKIELVPSDTLSISVDSATGKITFTAVDTTYNYEVNNNAGSVTTVMSGTNGDNFTVEHKAGKDLTVIGDAANDSITYAHAEYSDLDKKATNENIVAGQDINVISEIVTSNGHVTDIKIGTLTLPEDTNITAIELDGDWKRKVNESNGGSHSIDFSDEAAALKEELISEFTSGIGAANSAMTYKGTVASVDALNAKANVEVGDVWLFNDESGEYKSGDMAIAISSDGSVVSGVIPSDKVVWERIPSGDELNTDTLFKGVVTNGSNSVTYGIAPVSSSGVTSVEGNQDLTLNAGTNITITADENGATIAHEAITTSSPTANEAENKAEFVAITGLEVTNGHVTKVTKEKFVPETYGIEAAENKISLTTASGTKDDITVVGDKSISVTAANDQLIIAHNFPQSTNTTVKTVTNNELVAGGQLQILTGITYDDRGHVVNATTGSVTLPEDRDTTYDLLVAAGHGVDASVASKTANPYLLLKGSNGGAAYAQVKGAGSLSVIGNSNEISISMVWGEF